MPKTAARRTGTEKLPRRMRVQLGHAEFYSHQFCFVSDKLTNPPRSHTWISAQPHITRTVPFPGLLSVPSERDLTRFKSTLAPSKLIQPLEGEGSNAHSFLSTHLGVSTALKDLIPGKKNSQLIRMDTILVYYFICCKLKLNSLQKKK